MSSSGLETVVFVVIAAALLVAARLVLCGVAAVRTRRTGMAIISITGVLAAVTLLCAFVVIWFMYGVAHTGKDAKAFVWVLLVTGIPYVMGLTGLWILGGVLGSRLPSDAIRRRPAADCDEPLE